MNDELKMVVNAIVEEISRTEDRLNKRFNERFDKLEQRLDAMQHDINACKLEAGTLDREICSQV